MSQHQQRRSASAIMLVVENDVLKRVHSAAALRRRGFQVFEAADTTEAITILNKIAVDVLFSDVSLVGGAKSGNSTGRVAWLVRTQHAMQALY